MTTKTEQLDLLFEKWENNIPEYHGKFVKDGIIDEKLFNAAKYKILFITKEKNDPGQTPGDFRTWWKEELIYTFSIRISEWAYGILNDFPPYDNLKNSIPNKIKALHQIAFMNVKKSGGGGSSEFEGISSHIRLNYDFIHEEIRIIDPDIIILGLSLKGLRNQVFPDLQNKWVESGYDIDIVRFNNSKILDFYHPSSRNGPAAFYSLLQNIINSPSFKAL